MRWQGSSWQKSRESGVFFLSPAPDAESLLVSFLSELVYISEQDRLAFDQINLSSTLKQVRHVICPPLCAALPFCRWIRPSKQ